MQPHWGAVQTDRLIGTRRMPRTQVWRVHLNNALNALAEDFTEVANMLESR
jgi:hypothetical protein